jgi:5'-nucleotidase
MRCSKPRKILAKPPRLPQLRRNRGKPRRYWHEGVRTEPRGEKRFAVHGTPADCIRLGLLHLVPDANWVLSGINHGANLGADVYYSGTVAAVREAILHGWPGVAFSHYRKGADFDWSRATRWITPLLRELLDRPIEHGLFYNVNLPLLPAGAPTPRSSGARSIRNRSL